MDPKERSVGDLEGGVPPQPFVDLSLPLQIHVSQSSLRARRKPQSQPDLRMPGHDIDLLGLEAIKGRCKGSSPISAILSSSNLVILLTTSAYLVS